MTEDLEDLKSAALHYHRNPKAGKIRVTATKPLSNQRDLALAYSPGVAEPCKEIQANPLAAAEYTSRSNLVGVVSNGTAVLGLGNIGALASKPVMEGKAILFKNFADVDAFDIEVDATDVERFCDTVAALEPTFGGINLEDIKAPECFEIEQRLRERMNIPVFHDDQHGTAICSAAAGPIRRIAVPSVRCKNVASFQLNSSSKARSVNCSRGVKSGSQVVLANLFQGQTSWQSSHP